MKKFHITKIKGIILKMNNNKMKGKKHLAIKLAQFKWIKIQEKLY